MDKSRTILELDIDTKSGAASIAMWKKYALIDRIFEFWRLRVLTVISRSASQYANNTNAT